MKRTHPRAGKHVLCLEFTMFNDVLRILGPDVTPLDNDIVRQWMDNMGPFQVQQQQPHTDGVEYLIASQVILVGKTGYS